MARERKERKRRSANTRKRRGIRAAIQRGLDNPFVGPRVPGEVPVLWVGDDLVGGATSRRSYVDTDCCGKYPIIVGRGVQTAEEFLEALAHVHVHAVHELLHGAMADHHDEVTVLLAVTHMQVAQLHLLDMFALRRADDPQQAAELREASKKLRSLMESVDA